MAANQKKNFAVGATIVAVVSIAGIALFLTTREKPEMVLVEADPIVTEASPETVTAPEPETELEPIIVEADPVEVSNVVEEEAVHEDHESEYVVDPEDQPREYHVDDFRFPDRLSEFKLDGVKFVSGGITLEESQDGEDFRMGSVESPAINLFFPANAVGPMWKANTPDGTDVVMEVTMSPDGETWSDWFVIESDPHGEPAEFMPNGEPNPNYDFELGNLMTWGTNQWQYTKYRMSLYSDSEENPLLEGIRLYYVDSTLGEGKLVTLNDLEEMKKDKQVADDGAQGEEDAAEN